MYNEALFLKPFVHLPIEHNIMSEIFKKGGVFPSLNTTDFLCPNLLCPFHSDMTNKQVNISVGFYIKVKFLLMKQINPSFLF